GPSGFLFRRAVSALSSATLSENATSCCNLLSAAEPTYILCLYSSQLERLCGLKQISMGSPARLAAYSAHGSRKDHDDFSVINSRLASLRAGGQARPLCEGARFWRGRGHFRFGGRRRHKRQGASAEPAFRGASSSGLRSVPKARPHQCR